MTSISSVVEVSDIFDELLDENQRLLNQLVFADKCLNVLNKFKTFVDLVFNNYKIDFNSNDSQNYQTLKAEVEEVLNESQKLNEHLIEDPEKEEVVATEEPSTLFLNQKFNVHLIGVPEVEQLVATKEPSTGCLKQATNEVIESFECKVNGCQYKTTDSENFEQHFNENHKSLSKKFKCLFCKKDFFSELSVKSHIRRDHSNKLMDCLKPKPNKTIGLKSKCDIKRFNFTKQFVERHDIELNEHQIENPKEEVLATEEPSTLFLNQTTNKIIVLFECKVNGCQFKTTVSEDIERHFTEIHKNLSKKFECLFCCQSFLSELSVKSHMRRDHSNQQLRCLKPKPNKPNELKSKCDINGYNSKKQLTEEQSKVCLKQTSNKVIELFECKVSESHIKLTHEKGLKACDFDGCDYKTNQIPYLINHVNTVHKKIRPFKCPQCEATFGCEKYMRRHLKFFHRIALQCEYPGCGKWLKSKYTLKQHIDRIHLNIPPEIEYYCDEPGCQYKSYIQSLVTNHKKTVHTNERHFSCTFDGCVKTFKTNDSLKQHNRTHELKCRTFKCCECDQRFMSKQGLKYHSINKHSNMTQQCDWPGCDFQTKLETTLRKHKLVHKSELDFSCDWPDCHKKFKSKHYLELHIRVHTNDKRYECEWPGCQYRTGYSQNIIKHRRIHVK